MDFGEGGMGHRLDEIRPAELLTGSAEICVCVGLSALLAAGCAELHVNGIFPMFLPAIVLCCWLRGVAGAAAATLLSMLVLWYFFIPPEGFVVPTVREDGHLLVFLGVAIFVCRIILRQREANAALMQENFELGYKVFLLRELRRGSAVD
jgi:K+-sensing histidine kinase KdpD